jgi:hypothetical protein
VSTSSKCKNIVHGGGEYTSLPKNVPFLCQTIILRIPFSALYYYIFLLINLCHKPITYSEGIKRPCHPSGRELLTFMREGKMGEGFR